jgi:hypothetical protein
MSAIASVVEAGWSVYSNWPAGFTDTLMCIRVCPSLEGTIQPFREAFPRFTRILASLKDQAWRERVLSCVCTFVADWTSPASVDINQLPV